MKLNLIFRSVNNRKYSIETVFNNLLPFISEKLDVNVVKLPYKGADPTSLLKNLNYLKKVKSQVNHITGHVHYAAFLNPRNTVLTVHDIKSALTGSFVKRLYVLCLWFWIPCLLVKRITVISEFSKNELGKIVPFAKSKIRVIFNSYNQNFEFAPKSFNSIKPSILLIGVKPNKNLERTISALASINCQINIIGKITQSQMELLQELNIDYVNSYDLNDDQMKQAYIDCDLLVFASTYEGFGMPIIEAQSIGRPVVTSCIGAMREVAGGSSCLIDPYDVDSIQCGVMKIIEDSVYRKNLISSGLKNVRRFQPEVIAQSYISLYQEFYES